MMKITGLSHLFKWENLHNWWLTKYFFAPLYLPLNAEKNNHYNDAGDKIESHLMNQFAESSLYIKYDQGSYVVCV